MTLNAMQACATETLSYFIQTMPDAPFTEGDVIIKFVPKDKVTAKYMEFRAKYAPEIVINDSQKRDFAGNVFANALIGRKKSAVVVCIDPAMTKPDMRRALFHELMHIFCAKVEMDGEHFIDVYGTGTTKGTDPFDADYDGYLAAGYKVWSEFIANYYAIKQTEKRVYPFREVRQSVVSILNEVTNDNSIESKDLFAYACSYLFNCSDIDRVIEKLSEPAFIWNDSAINGANVRGTFLACTRHIHNHFEAEKPWKINEEYICELGEKFLTFRLMNSYYISKMQG